MLEWSTAVSDAALQASLLLLAVFALLCCIPALHTTVRSALRPAVLRHVEEGLIWVDYAQSFHHPLLTSAFQASAHTVSVSFYVTVLPFCIWVSLCTGRILE